MADERVHVFAEVEAETEKALKLSDNLKTEWVPKSQVKQVGDGVFEMPKWLAVKKGFY
jgi:hypothetical protein